MGDIRDWSLPKDLALLANLSESERSHFLDALRCKKTLETFLHVTDDFIYIKDKNHKFIYTSDAFAKLTGHQSWHELVGKDDFDIFPKEHASIYYRYEQTVIKEGAKLMKHEEPYYDQDGKLGWVSSTKNPVFDDNGNVIGLVGISKDITELKHQQKQIEYLARHDDLTRLHNRRALYETGEMLLKKARRDRHQVAMLYIDLERFKLVNDVYGHQVGDEVLQAFADHLMHSTRESDLVVRLGGDEFIVMMTASDNVANAAQHCAERIKTIEQSEVMKGSGASIGIAVSIANYDLTNLLSVSDKAMYKAKQTATISISDCV